MKRLHLPYAIVLLICTTSFARAQTPPPAAMPAWEQLSQAQRDELTAPIRERWNGAPGERGQMLEHARRWKAMSPQQRTRAHRGMQRFERMNPEKREQARAMFETMRSLPEAERRALRERWQKMTPDERRKWIEANRPAGR
ncbi:MAG: DUF3106 domain-containing protein [Lysobacter sp.]|nr:DUF3106 domain-containing protein [Lysobacter sp.]